LYALCAIIYNLLVGHPPHWDTSEHSADRLVDAARNDLPTSLAKLVPRAPADLRAIVERAMARKPDDRYRTGKEMAEELRRFEAGQLIGSREYTLRDLIARWCASIARGCRRGRCRPSSRSSGSARSSRDALASQRDAANR
jgi:hypothetical protein